MSTKLKIGHKRLSRTPIVTFEMNGLTVEKVDKVDWLQAILKEAYNRNLFLENSPEEFALLENCGTFFDYQDDHLTGWIVTLDTIEYQNHLKEFIHSYTKIPFKKEKRIVKTLKAVPEYFLPYLTHTLATLPNSVLAIPKMWLLFRLFLLTVPKKYPIPNIQNVEDFKNILFELENLIPNPWLQGKRYTLKVEEERLKQIKDCIEIGQYASLFNRLAGNCLYYSTRLGIRSQNRVETIALLNRESSARQALDIEVLCETVTITGYKKENRIYDFKIGQRGLFILACSYKNRKKLPPTIPPALLFLSVNDSSGLIDKIWFGYDDYEFDIDDKLYDLNQYKNLLVRHKNDQNEYESIVNSKDFIGIGHRKKHKNKILVGWAIRQSEHVTWHETLPALTKILENIRIKQICQTGQDELLLLKRIGFTITEELNAIFCWVGTNKQQTQFEKANRFINQILVITSQFGISRIKWPKLT